jgi:hypothetical protein
MSRIGTKIVSDVLMEDTCSDAIVRIDRRDIDISPGKQLGNPIHFVFVDLAGLRFMVMFHLLEALNCVRDKVRIHAFVMHATKQDQVVKASTLFGILPWIITRAARAFRSDVSHLAKWGSGISAHPCPISPSG